MSLLERNFSNAWTWSVYDVTALVMDLSFFSLPKAFFNMPFLLFISLSVLLPSQDCEASRLEVCPYHPCASAPWRTVLTMQIKHLYQLLGTVEEAGTWGHHSTRLIRGAGSVDEKPSANSTLAQTQKMSRSSLVDMMTKSVITWHLEIWHLAFSRNHKLQRQLLLG